MDKDKPPGQPNATPRGVTRKVVGSGITAETRTQFSGPYDDEGMALLKSVLERASYCPLAEIESTMRDFLREAGIPDDPTEGGKYPYRSHITPGLAENERHSGTWYAAAILDELSQVRSLYEVAADRDKKAVYQAALAGFRAGELYREGRMKAQWEKPVLKYQASVEGAVIAGSADKRTRPVVDWLIQTVKQYPEKPYTFFWNSLPDHDEREEPERINGAEMIREGGVLVVKGADGRKRFLAKSSFKRYVGDVKKDLKK